jgi:hypothetical protein
MYSWVVYALLGISIVLNFINLIRLDKLEKKQHEFWYEEKKLNKQSPIVTKSPPPPTPPAINPNQVHAYPGLDTSVVVSEAILGKGRDNDLDQYDTIYPAVLAEGTILARGKGRIILDGSESDILFKRNGVYFSLCHLLGLCDPIDRSPRPDKTPTQNDTKALLWQENICSGDVNIKFEDSETCPLRRNFGVDACTLDNGGTCWCGGGWQFNSRLIRMKHMICNASYTQADFGACASMFLETLAPLCCGPDGFTTCPTVENLHWIETRTTCRDTRADLCHGRDISDYLGFYERCRYTENSTVRQACLINARTRVNTHAWEATRDIDFDAGKYYHIGLPDDIWRDCLIPKLRLHHTHNTPYQGAFPADWTCDEDASPIWFKRDNEIITSPIDDSLKQGRLTLIPQWRLQLDLCITSTVCDTGA